MLAQKNGERKTIQGVKASAQKTKVREDSPVTTDSALQILSPNMRSRRTEPPSSIIRRVLPAIAPVHTQMPADKRGFVYVFVFWSSIERDSVSIVLGIFFCTVDCSHVARVWSGKSG
jgi:hypothetical protein